MGVLVLKCTVTAREFSSGIQVERDELKRFPMALEMPPEVEVELARRVPCSVTYHEITRDRKVER